MAEVRTDYVSRLEVLRAFDDAIADMEDDPAHDEWTLTVLKHLAAWYAAGSSETEH